MPDNDKIKNDWRTHGFDEFQSRQIPPTPAGEPQFIPGATFDALLDELLFNRMIQFKNLDVRPQGDDPGKTYWDPATKKLKVWVDAIGGWADVGYTTTSTSTSTTSSSSTSTSTTSSSTSTTSSSTSTTSSSTSTT